LIRATFDTNIFVSALLFGGLPQHLIDLVIEGDIDLVLSPFILGEFENKLKTKFGYSAQEAKEAALNVEILADIVIPKKTLTVIKRKDSDNRILECAVEGNVVALVTGNLVDLKPLGTFQGIEIVKPREFADKYFPHLKI